MACYILTTKKRDQRLFRKILTDPHIFETPRELLLAIRSNKRGPILIIDLEIRGHEKIGFQTAELVKKNNPNAQIILLAEDSRLANYCFEYQVGVLDFIIKNDRDLTFQKRLLRAIEKAQYNLHKIFYTKPIFVRFPNGTRSILVDLTHIIYISCEKGTHHLILHEHDRITKIRATLKIVVPLHKDTCQIHSSFAINLNYLKDYQPKKKIITLSTGNALPVSRRYASEVRMHTTWFTQPPSKDENPNFKRND